MMQTPPRHDLSSRSPRGTNVPYRAEMAVANADAFCPRTNPAGKINLASTSLNTLAASLWNVPAAHTVDAQTFCLTSLRGRHDLREELGRFLARNLDAPAPLVDEMSVLAGSSAVYDVLAHCLFEHGDAIVTTCPRYAAYDFDFGARAGVRVVHAESLRVEDLMRACRADGRVRGVLVCSPHNPLGTVTDAATLDAVSVWCRDTGRHLVCAEVYGASAWRAPHVSSLRLASRGSHVHTVWSASKDLGMTGARVGLLVSQHAALHAAIDSLAVLCGVAMPMQVLLRDLLRSGAADAFLEAYRDALRRTYETVAACLARNGLAHTPPDGGCFVYVDLRAWYGEDDDAWRRLFEETGVLLTPGAAQHAPLPGHARLCFARDAETMATVVHRLDAHASNAFTQKTGECT